MKSEEKKEVFPWRRFWSRIFDWSIISLLFGLALALIFLVYEVPNGLELRGIRAWILELVAFVIWVPLEAVILAKFGTTPGKWLLGVRIVGPNNLLPSFPMTTKRSWLVLMRGSAFNIPILNLVAFYLSYESLIQKGKSYWDIVCGTYVIVSPIRNLRIVLFIFLLILIRVPTFL